MTIIHLFQVVQLPRQPNVEAMLKEYYEHCVTGATEETKSVVN